MPSPNPNYKQEIKNVEGINKLKYPYVDTSNSPKTVNGVTFTDLGDGKILANGTSTGLAGFDFYTLSNPLEIDSNTEYTLIGGNTTLGVVLSFSEYDDNNNLVTTHDNVTTKTFTTSPTTTKLVGGIKRYSNQITINNFITKPMLIKGKIIPSEYVPYNSIAFKAHNRNFINNNDLNYIGTNILASQISLTTLDTGIRFTTTFKSGGVPSVTFRLFDLTPYAGKTIRIKATFANNGFIRISRESGDRNQKVTINTIPSNTIYSFDVPNDISSFGDAKYFCYALGITNPTANSTTVDFTDLILTIDDEDMTYEPYQEQVKYFTFEEGQYLAEGGYLEDRGIYNNRNHVVFDGVSDGRKVNLVNLYSSNGLYYCVCNNVFPDGKTFTDGANVENLVCTHFQSTIGVAINHCYRTGRGFTFVFVLIDQTITTAEQANAWLQEQYANGTPVKLEYPLENPQPTPYTPTQQAQWNEIKKMKTYKNVSHISTEGGTLDPSLDVVYYKDLETMFNEQDKIKQAIIALGGVI